MIVAADSTTVTKMLFAPTQSRDTAAPASRATWETAPSAEVGLLSGGAPPPASPPGLVMFLREIPAVTVVAEHSWFLLPVYLLAQGATRGRKALAALQLWLWVLVQFHIWMEHPQAVPRRAHWNQIPFQCESGSL